MATASHSAATSATPTLAAQPGVGAPTTVQATWLVVMIGIASWIRLIGADFASRSGSSPSIRVGNGLPVRLIMAGRVSRQARTFSSSSGRLDPSRSSGACVDSRALQVRIGRSRC